MQGVRRQQLQQQYMPFLASYMMEAKVYLLQMKNKRSGMQIMHCSGLRPYILDSCFDKLIFHCYCYDYVFSLLFMNLMLYATLLLIYHVHCMHSLELHIFTHLTTSFRLFRVVYSWPLCATTSPHKIRNRPIVSSEVVTKTAVTQCT